MTPCATEVLTRGAPQKRCAACSLSATDAFRVPSRRGEIMRLSWNWACFWGAVGGLVAIAAVVGLECSIFYAGRQEGAFAGAQECIKLAQSKDEGSRCM